MFTLILDSDSHTPLYEQLYLYIKKEIESDRLTSNDKLPSKRSLASHLKISRSTIETAYSQLLAEGYIRSRPGSGYYVENIGEKLYVAENKAEPISSEYEKETCTYKYDFKTSGVDTTYFPFSAWAKLSREVLAENSNEILNASHPQGLYILRKEISDYLYSFRDIKASPEQIIIGAGSEYLISFIIQLIGRNKIFGIENPGYNKIQKIFSCNDVKTVPVDIDVAGINVNSLDKYNISTIHITPSHHFPLGIVMPVSRRMDLLNWAAKSNDRFIIEDDYDSEFRFSGKPIPALQSMDSFGNVIYMNTFAKTLAPSFRISYIVLPYKLMKIYYSKFSFYSCTVPSFEQYTLYKFMHNGNFERHINRMRNVYRSRRDSLISAIQQSHIADFIEITGQNAGLHFIMHVNNGMSEKELIESAMKYNIRVYGLSEYYQSQEVKLTDSAVVIGYSAVHSDSFHDFINCIEKAWYNSV